MTKASGKLQAFSYMKKAEFTDSKLNGISFIGIEGNEYLFWAGLDKPEPFIVAVDLILGRHKINGAWDGDTTKTSRPCAKNCKYRMPYEQLGRQRNALRVEIMTPSDRCGWALKNGRVGGRPDDYLVCNKGGN